MRFKSFFDEAVRVHHVSEEDYEEHEAADAIMKQVKVRVNSRKELTFIAEDNGEVVGALYSGWGSGEGLGDLEGQQVMMFDWDIGVAPTYQNKGVGKLLVAAAMQSYNSEKHSYGEETMIYVHVINPILASYLEKTYGFITAEAHGTEKIMYKY